MIQNALGRLGSTKKEMADDAVRLYGEERYIRPNLSIAPSALPVAEEPIRISPFVVLSLPQRCIQTTTEVGLRLQPSFTTTIPSDRPPYTPAPSQSSDSPSANHSSSGIEPGGWVNPQDKGKKSEEKNRMMMEWKRRNTHIKREVNASSSLRCRRCKLIEV